MTPNPVYSITTNPKGISPLLDGFSFPVNVHKRIGAGVVHLLFLRSPSAVIRRVISVVIDSINGVAGGWARPHIRKKGFKIFRPPVTNLYSSGEIILASRVVRVVASTTNIKPRKIFGRMSHAMFGAADGSRLSSKASARLVVSPSEVIARRYFDIAAFADAFPMSIPISAWGFANNRKAVVYITNFVLKSDHNILRKMLIRIGRSGSRHGRRFSVANLATYQLYHMKAL